MRELLWTSGRGLVDGNTVWFVPYKYSCLCQYDYKTDKIMKFIFLDETTAMKGTHYNLLWHGNSIVLIPTRDMNIFIYDVENEKLHRIGLKGRTNAEEKFIAASVQNEYIYMFPVFYPQILKLNMKNMHVEYIECKSAQEYFDVGADYTHMCVTIGSIANLLMMNSNKICEFDMQSDSERVIAIGENGICYKTICQYGETGLILSDQHGNIVILDENKKVIANIASEEDVYFNNCIPVLDGYLFIPYNSNADCILWDGTSRKKIDIGVKNEATAWADRWKYSTYSAAYYDNKRALLFHLPNKSLCILDRQTCVAKEHYIWLEEITGSMEKKMYTEFQKHRLMTERGIGELSLKGFLKHTGENKTVKSQIKFVGEKIYHTLMNI